MFYADTHLVAALHFLGGGGKPMRGGAHGCLFEDTSPWQKIEGWQHIDIAQGGQHFSWFGCATLHWTFDFLFLLLFILGRCLRGACCITLCRALLAACSSSPALTFLPEIYPWIIL